MKILFSSISLFLLVVSGLLSKPDGELLKIENAAPEKSSVKPKKHEKFWFIPIQAVLNIVRSPLELKVYVYLLKKLRHLKLLLLSRQKNLPPKV